MQKTCKSKTDNAKFTGCGKLKDISEFYLKKSGNYKNICKECCKQKQKKYYLNNKNEVLEKQKIYNKNNCEKIKERKKEHYKNNIEQFKIKNKELYDNNILFRETKKQYSKKYRQENRDKVLLAQKEWYYKKIQEPGFRIKEAVRSNFRMFFKKLNYPSSFYNIFVKNLPYTREELLNHLEKQFEYWMNWDNYGSYDLNSWDDNNPATWKWQIDHIIPQSYLPFNSIDDENFKKCWALENLRPYSAKQNILDGKRKIIK